MSPSAPGTQRPVAPGPSGRLAAAGPAPGGAVTAAAPARRRPRRLRKATPYLFIAPAMVIFVLFTLAPLLHTFWLSMYDWDGITPGTWTGLANYKAMWEDPQLRAIFWHPFLLIVFYSLIPIAIGLAITAVMTRVRVHGLTFFRALLFLPYVIATVSVALAWRDIYSIDGPLNHFLSAVGLGGVTRAWLGDWHLALPSLGLIGTWVSFGFCMVLFLAGAQKIPRELFESARVDGANAWQETRHVLVPGLRREVVVALVLTVINALRTFDINYVLTKGGPGLQTDVPAFEVYRQAFIEGHVGEGAAFGVVLTLLLLLIVVPLSRLEGRTR